MPMTIFPRFQPASTLPAAQPSLRKKSVVIGGLPTSPRIPSVPKYFRISAVSLPSLHRSEVQDQRGCASDRQGMRDASSWREPRGRVVPVAASYPRAGNQFRRYDSTVKIDTAQDVQVELVGDPSQIAVAAAPEDGDSRVRRWSPIWMVTAHRRSRLPPPGNPRPAGIDPTSPVAASAPGLP